MNFQFNIEFLPLNPAVKFGGGQKLWSPFEPSRPRSPLSPFDPDCPGVPGSPNKSQFNH